MKINLNKHGFLCFICSKLFYPNKNNNMRSVAYKQRLILIIQIMISSFYFVVVEEKLNFFLSTLFLMLIRVHTCMYMCE